MLDPEKESRRLGAARAIRMIGTPAEERFDKITRLGRRLFNVPVCLINIVGANLLWVKSAQGLDLVEWPRFESYCQYTVLEAGICHIPDARTDERVKHLPGSAHWVFYAGMPLRYQGQNVGALCIADSTTRDFPPEDMVELESLAGLVERELELTALSEAQLRLAAEVDELETKALVDSLTRSWNRGAIYELAARELEGGTRDGTPTSFILLDIDNFKNVNDTHGHAGGDEVLRRVPAVIRGAVRPNDALGRYGGEEFLLVLPNCNADQMLEVAERVRGAVEHANIDFEGTHIPVTISLGCTCSSGGNHFVELLVRAADEALYDAKKNGRNRVCKRLISSSLQFRVQKPQVK